MSEAVRTTQDPAQAVRQLGMTSAARCGLLMLGTGCLIAVVGLVMASGGPKSGLAVGGLLFMLFAVPLFLWSVVQFLAALLVGGGPRARTRKALLAGRIGMTYLAGGGVGENYVVVDEERRLVAIDGHVFGFDDVRRLACQSRDGVGQLDFTLRSGDAPLRSARIKGEPRLQAAFARVSNSLKFE